MDDGHSSALDLKNDHVMGKNPTMDDGYSSALDLKNDHVAGVKVVVVPHVKKQYVSAMKSGLHGSREHHHHR